MRVTNEKQRVLIFFVFSFVVLVFCFVKICLDLFWSFNLYLLGVDVCCCELLQFWRLALLRGVPLVPPIVLFRRVEKLSEPPTPTYKTIFWGYVRLTKAYFFTLFFMQLWHDCFITKSLIIFKLLVKWETSTKTITIKTIYLMKYYWHWMPTMLGNPLWIMLNKLSISTRFVDM
jgi:hypothetical protein